MAEVLRLPGLIDTHVHCRQPWRKGEESPETYFSASRAAISSGVIAFLEMPNNPPPTTTAQALREKLDLADGQYCDIGLYFGAIPASIEYFEAVKRLVFGYKLYANQTTGNLLVRFKKDQRKIFQAAPEDSLILVHAEGPTVGQVIELAEETWVPVHICHVSQASELKMIEQAKAKGLPVTCEVTPHHLFLNRNAVRLMGPFAMMRPPLRKVSDTEALWEGLANGLIDTIGSDHIPHTKVAKKGPIPPSGVPGVETTLPLMLTAVNYGKLTLDRLTELTYKNPAKIFHVPLPKNTYIEVDPDEVYKIDHGKFLTACGWSPFNGWEVQGRVKKVVLRGQNVFENGEIVGPPQGHVIFPSFAT